jgi:hypothetical protein
MLLQSLRALCKAPGGAGSIWKYLEALVRATAVSGRFAYGFQTDLHFADEVVFQTLMNCHWWIDEVCKFHPDTKPPCFEVCRHV